MSNINPYRYPLSVSPFGNWFDDVFENFPTPSDRVMGTLFPVDVEELDEGYVVKAYLAGASREDINVELNEGRLSITVKTQDKHDESEKRYIAREFKGYNATRGVYLKDASCDGLSAKLSDGILTILVPKIIEKNSITKISID